MIPTGKLAHDGAAAAAPPLALVVAAVVPCWLTFVRLGAGAAGIVAFLVICEVIALLVAARSVTLRRAVGTFHTTAAASMGVVCALAVGVVPDVVTQVVRFTSWIAIAAVLALPGRFLVPFACRARQRPSHETALTVVGGSAAFVAILALGSLAPAVASEVPEAVAGAMVLAVAALAVLVHVTLARRRLRAWWRDVVDGQNADVVVVAAREALVTTDLRPVLDEPTTDEVLVAVGDATYRDDARPPAVALACSAEELSLWALLRETAQLRPRR